MTSFSRKHLEKETASVGLGGIFASAVGVALFNHLPLLAVAVLSALAFLVVGMLTLVLMSIRSLRIELARTDNERLASWRLEDLASEDKGLVRVDLGRAALRPTTAVSLLEHVTSHDARTIVELGPGTSTILLARLQGSRKIFCVEHDEKYYSILEQMLKSRNIETPVLIHAPLEYQQIESWEGKYYSATSLAALPASIDFLLVDGPPNYEGDNSRFPALPALFSHLASDAIVFVDDVERRQEADMVAKWRQSYPLKIIHEGTDHVVLKRE